jgi:formylglycine-generating enzyme required for sulfatase activity
VTTSTGAQRCSPCTEAIYECGPVCCEQQTCLSETVGACGTAYGKPGRSCEGGLVCPISTAGRTMEDADCCESIPLPGGKFSMGRSFKGDNRCPPGDDARLSDCTIGVDELPAHTVNLSPFALERFEVTVGRFRRFADGWDYHGLPVGAGGDAAVAGAGWQTSWNTSLPTSRAELDSWLGCGAGTPSLCTWTPMPGPNEDLPINAVNWFVAFAFCAWDGGRLPTEAEWEFAAANGHEASLYPWGQAPPSAARATYGCVDCVLSDIEAVGSSPGGENRWGHRDLAANLSEWTLDEYAPYPTRTVVNYASVTTDAYRFNVFRGGAFDGSADALRSAARSSAEPWQGFLDVGVRCARSP